MKPQGHLARPRVGVLATHPVQYYVPWYRELARAVDLEVFFGHRQTADGQGRAGFGLAFDWDVPLLDGYAHRFLRNRAARPDVSSFLGCHTPEIGAIVASGGFDAFLVHGWASRSFWQAIAACRRSGTPVLVRGDSQLGSPRSRARRLAKWPLYRLFIPRFDGYLVVGQRAREYYAHYGADPARMFFAPHGVDNQRFGGQAEAARGERARLRAGWGIPAGAVVFLFAGKLVEDKRPLDFARAVAAASRRRPNAFGLVAGDGPLRATVETAARDVGWPLRFAGFLNQSEMPRAYAASDALILPSLSESWGLVVNEAMACGLPAIVSDRVGCGPDLVQPGETGDVFPCGDVDRLAALVEELAADPWRRRRLGDNAQRLVQRYSPHEAARGTIEAVQAVMERRARPASRAERHTIPHAGVPRVD